MLRVNRLRIEIDTSNGLYGFDEEFHGGLNFIASKENTCGKSSVLDAIYYGLGFEEIIGGRGEKVLTAVYKSTIKDGETVCDVLKSRVLIELNNGADTITVFRSALDVQRKSNLVTVYYSPMNAIYEKETVHDEMYIHLPNAAVNEKGYHKFLESFIGFDLPDVSTSDNTERKLYLQLVFSGMFIEQKRGWADLFSAMPYLGVKDARKRVVEFIIGLEVTKNERWRNDLAFKESRVKDYWHNIYRDIYNEANRVNCKFIGIPQKPEVLDMDFDSGIYVFKGDESGPLLNGYIESLWEKYSKLSEYTPKVVDNYKEIEAELQETEAAIDEFETEVSELRKAFYSENLSINKLVEELENIRVDISNNTDARKLRDLGADVGSLVLQNICPVCNQKIQDTLLPSQEEFSFMSIDDNIKHLNAQKEMYEFALQGHREHKKELDEAIQDLTSRITALRRLAQSLRNDIYAVNEEVSESQVYKKLEIKREIEELEKFQMFFEHSIEKVKHLAEQWKAYEEERKRLPKKKFTDEDEDKLECLKSHFIQSLQDYGYKSVDTLDAVEISRETYLPIKENFDMKFDSSASDNIRAIWAFTVALMNTAIDKLGNHPTMLIFDEPDQHSIVMKDLVSFFNSIIEIKNKCQVIVGITIKDRDTEMAIEQLNKENYHMIEIQERAIRKL